MTWRSLTKCERCHPTWGFAQPKVLWGQLVVSQAWEALRSSIRTSTGHPPDIHGPTHRLTMERVSLRDTSSASRRATPHASLRDTSTSTSASSSSSSSSSSTIDIFHHHHYHHHVDHHEGPEGEGTRITSGNTKRITSGNIQKSHTPHTLDAHIGQHGFHHFGQHGKHRSYHLITWLSHLRFGWGGGEGSFYLHHYLTQPFHHDLMLSPLLLTLSSSRSWWRWRWIKPGRRTWFIATRIVMMKWWWWW